ncbi:hypothetical protein HK101_010143 [Irineochytrium annulatum]|nr:hypothetical protein HK101_010143 [Irineochytrium annulatum]
MSYGHDHVFSGRSRGAPRRLGLGAGVLRRRGGDKLPPLPTSTTVAGPAKPPASHVHVAKGLAHISAEGLCSMILADMVQTLIIDVRPKELAHTLAIRLSWRPPEMNDISMVRKGPHHALLGSADTTTGSATGSVRGSSDLKPFKRTFTSSNPMTASLQGSAYMLMAKSILNLLGAGAEDFLHPANKLVSKRIVFVDHTGDDNGLARMMANTMLELKEQLRDGGTSSGSLMNISLSNFPRELMYLKGGVQNFNAKFPMMCWAGEPSHGRSSVLSDNSKHNEGGWRDSTNTQKNSDDFFLQEPLQALGEPLADPSVVELFRKRMALQMTILAMVNSPSPGEDPPRPILYYALDQGIYMTTAGTFAKKVGNVGPASAPPQPFLFLGSQESAKPQQLKTHGISHVIRLGNCRWPHSGCTGITYHDFGIDDVHTARISSLFSTTSNIIDGIKARGEKVLVHCQAGVSRSASVVIAYIQRRGLKGSGSPILGHQRTVGWVSSGNEEASVAPTSSVSFGTCASLRDAFETVHISRPIICPNPGFWTELEQFERVLFMAASNVAANVTGFANPLPVQAQTSSLP